MTQTPRAWADALGVHLDEIDAQHKSVFALIDELDAALRCPSDRAVVGALLSRLTELLGEHVRHEEGLMDRSRYPRTLEHRAQHDQLIRWLGDLTYNYERGHDAATRDILCEFVGWFSRHTRTADHAFAGHLRKRVPQCGLERVDGER